MSPRGNRPTISACSDFDLLFFVLCEFRFGGSVRSVVAFAEYRGRVCMILSVRLSVAIGSVVKRRVVVIQQMLNTINRKLAPQTVKSRAEPLSLVMFRSRLKIRNKRYDCK